MLHNVLLIMLIASSLLYAGGDEVVFAMDFDIKKSQMILATPEKALFSIDSNNAFLHFFTPALITHYPDIFYGNLRNRIQKKLDYSEIDFPHEIEQDIADISNTYNKQINYVSDVCKDNEASYLTIISKPTLDLWEYFSDNKTAISITELKILKNGSYLLKNKEYKNTAQITNVKRACRINEYVYLLHSAEHFENTINKLLLLHLNGENLVLTSVESELPIANLAVLSRHPEKNNVFFMAFKNEYNGTQLHRVTFGEKIVSDLIGNFEQADYMIKPFDSNYGILCNRNNEVIIDDLSLHLIGQYGIAISLQDAQRKLAWINTLPEEERTKKRATFIQDLIAWSYYKQWKSKQK